VRYVKFSYYDAAGRHDRWDTADGLPQAVEIELGVLSDPLPKGAESAAELVETATNVANVDERESEQWLRIKVFRLLVRVPAASATPQAAATWATETTRVEPVESAAGLFGTGAGATP
jgi:hypothetical protein